MTPDLYYKKGSFAVTQAKEQVVSGPAGSCPSSDPDLAI